MRMDENARGGQGVPETENEKMKEAAGENEPEREVERRRVIQGEKMETRKLALFLCIIFTLSIHFPISARKMQRRGKWSSEEKNHEQVERRKG
jgi:uncharacterized DUF497 family protein